MVFFKKNFYICQRKPMFEGFVKVFSGMIVL